MVSEGKYDILVCVMLHYIFALEAAISVTMDTLQHWSDTTSQPISLVASCHALEQLKLLSDNRATGVCDRNFFTTAQKKVSNTACLGRGVCILFYLL